MNLGELLAAALGKRPDLSPLEVTGVVQDHRRVRPGVVFVARRGATRDGHDYLPEVLEQGAIAVVGERSGVAELADRGVPYIRVDDDRAALAKLAAVFFAHPSRLLTTIGVTGTDGKTTTSFLLHHLLTGSVRSGLLSTAGVRCGKQNLDLEGHFTTPEAPEVQELLAIFVRQRCSHAVIEASSHGLAMHRLDAVDFDVGVWTNLSREHLDYHGTLEAYRDAKRQLLRRARRSILNRDDPNYPAFAEAARNAASFGTHEESDWQASDIRTAAKGLTFSLHRAGEQYRARLPMVGSYNVHNALAALAAASLTGVPLTTLLERLTVFPGVPGRMQMVTAEPYAVIVDFAHTPAALRVALSALRPFTSGRLILVIGAAGERDPDKREPLGRAAANGADLIIFTEEDSRSEETERILAGLARGARQVGSREGENYLLIPDRRDAIGRAIGNASPGDTVLLAGKGHERTLERADEVLPWDEVAEAKKHLL